MDELERVANIIENNKNIPCTNGEYCPYNPLGVCYQKGRPICVFLHDTNKPYVPSERQKELDNEKKIKVMVLMIILYLIINQINKYYLFI